MQQPGDIGVCFDEDTSIPGADHVYLVLQNINKNKMVVVDNQYDLLHFRCVDGSDTGYGGKTPTEYFLRAPGYTPPEVASISGAHFLSVLDTNLASSGDAGRQAVAKFARTSAFAARKWGHGQGVMPIGYTIGMALSYARAVCELKAGKSETMAMTVPDRKDDRTDALTFYSKKLAKIPGNASEGGIDTLRKLFNVLIGLGVVESSGRWYCGRDMGANFDQAETAEAGLFQASYGAMHANRSMRNLYAEYKGRTDFLDVFKEGAGSPDSDNLKNWGEGDGAIFQALTKNCPAFAAQYAALCLRYNRKEFGTLRDGVVEVTSDCDDFLRGIEDVLSKNGISSI
mgnify:CR=1 FL=1